jgi:ferrous iron transport protein A
MMLEKGAKYQVNGFTSACPRGYMQKLMSMGFIPGAQFTIRKLAPLGDPYQIEIQGYSVSMRKSEVALVEVEAV